MAFDADRKSFYQTSSEQVARYQTDGRLSYVTWRKLPTSEKLRVIAHPRRSGLIYVTPISSGATPYIYYSHDSGDTWQKVLGEQSMSDIALYFDHDQGQVVYAVSRGSKAFASRSNDAGRTWESCANTNIPTPFQLSSSETRTVIDPNNSNHLFIATRGWGIWLSEDGCKTWVESNKGLRNLFVITLAIDPKNPNRVYAGTDGGAYISNNSGKTWFQVNDGLLGATVIYSIVVDPRDSSVYAATPYGVFKLEAK
jgi:photosystem II stability/assembly factor-like uncharacterized protein